MQKVRFKLRLDRWVDFEDAELRTTDIFISNILGRWRDEKILYEGESALKEYIP